MISVSYSTKKGFCLYLYLHWSLNQWLKKLSLTQNKVAWTFQVKNAPRPPVWTDLMNCMCAVHCGTLTFTAMFLCSNLKFAKIWTLFSNNLNTTIRKYSSSDFIWVVTPLGFVGQFRIYKFSWFSQIRLGSERVNRDSICFTECGYTCHRMCIYNNVVKCPQRRLRRRRDSDVDGKIVLVNKMLPLFVYPCVLIECLINGAISATPLFLFTSGDVIN